MPEAGSPLHGGDPLWKMGISYISDGAVVSAAFRTSPARGPADGGGGDGAAFIRQDAVRPAQANQLGAQAVDLRRRMARRDRAAQQAFTRRRGGRQADIDVVAAVQQRPPHRQGRVLGLQADGDDGAGRRAQLEAGVGKRAVEAVDIAPEPGAQFRPRPDRRQRRPHEARRGRRQGGGEHVGPAGDAQDIELVVVGHAVAADGAQALGEGADHEVDLVQHAFLLGQAASAPAQHAHRVGLVHQDVGAVGAADLDDRLQRRDVAEHRIDPLDHHQLDARLAGQAAQARVEAGGVVVA